MREKAGGEQALAGIDEGVFRNAIIRTLMMFLPKADRVVTQGEQKVVIAVMVRLIQGGGFGYQSFVFVDDFGGDVQSPGIIRHHIQVVRKFFSCRQGKHFGEFA